MILWKSQFWKSQASREWSSNIFPLLISIGIAIFALLAATLFRPNLRATILQHGRYIWGGPQVADEFTKFSWAPTFSALLDGDHAKGAILPTHCKPPEECSLTILLAFTHSWQRGQKPLVRKSDHLNIYNGLCNSCPPEQFQQIARVKELQLEIFWQTAHIDRKPPVNGETRAVWKKRVTLPDQPLPFAIDLTDIPTPAEAIFTESTHSNRDTTARKDIVPFVVDTSKIYTILMKLTILSTYPGKQKVAGAALAEIEYADRSVDGKLYYWR